MKHLCPNAHLLADCCVASDKLIYCNKITPISLLPKGCKCGVKKSRRVGRRIVGGQGTEVSLTFLSTGLCIYIDPPQVNEYPWIALLSIVFPTGWTGRCSGSLFASQWIVTAAHCVHDGNGNLLSKSSVTGVLGEHDTTTTESTIPRKVVKVSKIIPHGKYSHSALPFDIALLKLTEKVDLNVYTPVCLPNTRDVFIGKTAWVYGKYARALHNT